MTNQVFQTPKVGDTFTDITSEQFVVTNLFEVQNDSWIEYQNSIKQPFYCRTETFLLRFNPIATP